MATAASKMVCAFPDPGDGEGRRKYADWLQASFFQIVASARRTATATALLIGLFLVFYKAKSVDITVGPAKVTNVSVLLVVTPAAVSFLLYELAVLVFAYWRFDVVTEAFFAHCFPNLYVTGLYALVGPPTPSVWGGEELWQRLRGKPPGRLFKFRALSGIAVLIALGFVSVAFLAISLIYVQRHLHVNSVVFIGSVGCAVVNVVRTLILVADEIPAIRSLRAAKASTPDHDDVPATAAA